MPPRVFQAGPVFALVQPLVYAIETQPSENALHPLSDHHDYVAVGTEMMLVLIVVMIGAWRVIVEIVEVPSGSGRG